MSPSFIILGCGPVGGIFAAFAAPHAERMAAVDANDVHLQKIRESGLKIVIRDELKTTRFDGLCRSLSDAGDLSYDYLVIALKTPVMERVIPIIAPEVPKGVKILSVQNGIGTEDFLAGYFEPRHVFRMVVNYAGTILEPGVIKQTFFHPPNYVGAYAKESTAEAKMLADFLTKAGLDTEFTEEIRRYEWEKTILNATGSSISALSGLDLKQMMAFAPTRRLAENLLKEAICVGANQKIGLRGDYLDRAMHYLDSAGPHIPSMRIDLENRQETEINFLNQKIIDAGKGSNIPTPFLEGITSLIRGTEDSHRSSRGRT
jgi:2-dehydropantoate 2-reductase